MSGQDTLTLSLAAALESAVAPLDSLTDILLAGGFYDVALVSSALIRDSRTKLRSAAQCVEAGCGHPLTVHDYGGILTPVKCPHCVKDQHTLAETVLK